MPRCSRPCGRWRRAATPGAESESQLLLLRGEDPAMTLLLSLRVSDRHRTDASTAGFRHLVSSAQLLDPTLEPLHAGPLIGGQQQAVALIDLGLPHPHPQRLVVDVELVPGRAITFHCNGYSFLWSKTIRSARARRLGEIPPAPSNLSHPSTISRNRAVTGSRASGPGLMGLSCADLANILPTQHAMHGHANSPSWGVRTAEGADQRPPALTAARCQGEGRGFESRRPLHGNNGSGASSEAPDPRPAPGVVVPASAAGRARARAARLEVASRGRPENPSTGRIAWSDVERPDPERTVLP
jgi:hypothetical protein